MHYLKRGAASRPLAPSARRIRPPLAPLPPAGAGAGGSSADTDSRAPGKIESNMVTEDLLQSPRRSEAAPNVVNPPCLAPLNMVHSTQHTVHFWPKKMGKLWEGSSRVVISQPQWQLLSKAYNIVFLAAPSPMFPKRNRHPYPKSPVDRSKNVTCKCREFLIDSVDVTLVLENGLQLQRCKRWFWQL